MKALSALFVIFFLIAPVHAETQRPPRIRERPSASRPYELASCRYVLNSAVIETGPFGIRVQRPGYTYTDSYLRTNRNLERLQPDYPASMLNVAPLVGKRVLDAGTGDGDFVYELHARGVDIVGIDLALNASQKIRPELFVQADMLALPFADNEFDVIYSSWSLISYEFITRAPQPSQNIITVLKEMRRVLKPGGVARIAPVERRRFEKNLALVAGFIISPQSTEDAIELIKE